MSDYHLTTFVNWTERPIDVAVEPWAMSYTLEPKQQILVETAYDPPLDERQTHMAHFACEEGDRVTIWGSPSRPIDPAGSIVFPSAVRITMPDRVEIYGAERLFEDSNG